MAEPTKMNMTERKELRKLVEQRFDLLSERLAATELHIRNAIGDRIEAEVQEQVQIAEEETRSLKERAEQAERDHDKALRDIEKDYMAMVARMRKAGVEPDTTFGSNGRKRRGYGSRLEGAEELSYVCWSVADKDKRVQREFAKVSATKGDARQALMEKRNEMLTDIIMGVFQSTEAKSMLDSIPTLDNFIKIDKVNALMEIEG